MSSSLLDTELKPASTVSAVNQSSMNQWTMPSLKGDSGGPLSPEEQNQATETLFESARQKGYQQGLLEGRQSASIEIDAALEMLQSCQSQFENPLSHLDETVLKAITRLSVDLAEKIIRAEIATKPDLMKVQMDQALSVISDITADVSVRMHPEDAQAVVDLIGGVPSHPRKLNIIEDQNLGRGDCILNTPLSYVESTIKEKLQQMGEQIEVLIEHTTGAEPEIGHRDDQLT